MTSSFSPTDLGIFDWSDMAEMMAVNDAVSLLDSYAPDGAATQGADAPASQDAEDVAAELGSILKKPAAAAAEVDGNVLRKPAAANGGEQIGDEDIEVPDGQPEPAVPHDSGEHCKTENGGGVDLVPPKGKGKGRGKSKANAKAKAKAKVKCAGNGVLKRPATAMGEDTVTTCDEPKQTLRDLVKARKFNELVDTAQLPQHFFVNNFKEIYIYIY